MDKTGELHGVGSDFPYAVAKPNGQVIEGTSGRNFPFGLAPIDPKHLDEIVSLLRARGEIVRNMIITQKYDDFAFATITIACRALHIVPEQET